MDDLIRREDAMMYARPEYLNPQQEKLASYNQGWNNAIEMYYRQISELPSAEPQVGSWINVCWLTVQCSNCKSEFHELEAINYCPNCGTKMERKTDE